MNLVHVLIFLVPNIPHLLKTKNVHILRRYMIVFAIDLNRYTRFDIYYAGTIMDGSLIQIIFVMTFYDTVTGRLSDTK